MDSVVVAFGQLGVFPFVLVQINANPIPAALKTLPLRLSAGRASGRISPIAQWIISRTSCRARGTRLTSSSQTVRILVLFTIFDPFVAFLGPVDAIIINGVLVKPVPLGIRYIRVIGLAGARVGGAAERVIHGVTRAAVQATRQYRFSYTSVIARPEESRKLSHGTQLGPPHSVPVSSSGWSYLY